MLLCVKSARRLFFATSHATHRLLFDMYMYSIAEWHTSSGHIWIVTFHFAFFFFILFHCRSRLLSVHGYAISGLRTNEACQIPYQFGTRVHSKFQNSSRCFQKDERGQGKRVHSKRMQWKRRHFDWQAGLARVRWRTIDHAVRTGRLAKLRNAFPRCIQPSPQADRSRSSRPKRHTFYE